MQAGKTVVGSFVLDHDPGVVRVAATAGLDFLQRQNERTQVWILVENQRLSARLDEVSQLPGVDGVLLGPYDLSVDLGVPGEVEFCEPCPHTLFKSFHIYNKTFNRQSAIQMFCSKSPQ